MLKKRMIKLSSIIFLPLMFGTCASVPVEQKKVIPKQDEKAIAVVISGKALEKYDLIKNDIQKIADSYGLGNVIDIPLGQLKQNVKSK